MNEEDEAFNDIERQAKQRKEAVKAAINKEKPMKNTPAFPLNTPKWHESVSDAGFEDNNDFTMGMTLRDYFAAKAMLRTSVGSSYEQLAKNAYEIADAMLKAREA